MKKKQKSQFYGLFSLNDVQIMSVDLIFLYQPIRHDRIIFVFENKTCIVQIMFYVYLANSNQIFL